MSTIHAWRIKKEYFYQLRSGAKKLEIRVGYSWVRKVKKGDLIRFEHYDTPNTFLVKRISIYKSFESMLESEDVDMILPGVTSVEALKILQGIYHKGKEKLHVYVFELSHTSPERTYVEASKLVEDGRALSKLIEESYLITDWISKDYPNHLKHFYCKYVPGIFLGKRNIISCYIGDKIVATSFLKKDDKECKISTLFVNRGYRGNGIGAELLEKCFCWLDTSKPLITIADYKACQFAGIIKKYDWQRTQVLARGFYNKHSREYVFNGDR